MGKILYVASTFSHISSFHKDYIEGLRARGNTVLIMAKGDMSDIPVPFEKKMLSPKNKRARAEIKRAIKENDFDLIILNTSLAAFHVRLVLHRKDRPRVVNIAHGYLFSKHSYGGIKSGLKRLMLIYAEKLLRGKTDFVLTMNEEDYMLANKLRLSRGGVANTLGMGVKKRVPTRRREEVREELSLGDRFTLVFVGELSKRKNQSFLIKSLATLKKDIPDVALLLVGEGDIKERLRSEAVAFGVSENVIFTGRKEDIENYINAADVYVSASVSEGLPFNIVEALGCGADVVASAVKGHTDILKDGAGATFTLNSEEEFCKAVLGIKNGEITISNKLKEDAFLRFSFDEVYDKTLGEMIRAADPEGRSGI